MRPEKIAVTSDCDVSILDLYLKFKDVVGVAMGESNTSATNNNIFLQA